MKNFFISFLIGGAVATTASLHAQFDSDIKVRQEIERQYAQYIKSFGEADAVGVANIYDENWAGLSKGSKIHGRKALDYIIRGAEERVKVLF